VRVFDFRHGAAGKILKTIMRAAFKHALRQSPGRPGRQPWRSLLFVLRNTPLSGGTETALALAFLSRKWELAGESPRIFNELAKSRR
jgi:hypothetical protein